MYKQRISLSLASLGLAVFLGGCTVGQFHRLGPNSHFAYPNSNVKDLGPVSAKIPGTASWLVFPSHMTAEIDQKIYDAAMQQVDGANTIIDYVRTTTIRVIPLLNIFWTSERIEGTAARMEIGRQHLN